MAKQYVLSRNRQHVVHAGAARTERRAGLELSDDFGVCDVTDIEDDGHIGGGDVCGFAIRRNDGRTVQRTIGAGGRLSFFLAWLPPASSFLRMPRIADVQ